MLYLEASDRDKEIARLLSTQLEVKPGANLDFDNEAGINLFYQMRHFLPLWHQDGRLTEDAHKLIRRMEDADFDGLVAKDYRVNWRPSSQPVEDDKTLIARELELSAKIVRYFQDARRGRIDPELLPGEIGYTLKSIPANKVLASFEASTDALALLENANPKFLMFKELRDSLRKIVLAERTAEKLKENAAFDRDRWDDPAQAIRTINAELAAQVASHNVWPQNKPDTSAGLTEVDNVFVEPVNRVPFGSTLRFLEHRKADIITNMEMIRWMPHEFGDKFVWVNIPEFLVRVYDHNEEVYQGRVVVGKARHRTPIFADEIEHVVVNPYWNVPRSIAAKEMLPKIFRGKGLGRSFRIISPTGRIVSASKVPWGRFIRAGYRIRQQPGPKNALGTIKFLFPNQFSVYLHDTPSKSLFNRAVRAFSHGCIRLAEPWVFADVLSSLQSDLWIEDLEAVKGGSKEEWFTLSEKIPVVITYLTLSRDLSGRWRESDDVYGYLGAIRGLLGYS